MPRSRKRSIWPDGARRRALVLAFVVLLASVATATGDAAPRAGQNTHKLVVGAILDLKSGWTSLGRASRVTLRLAASDANAALERNGSSLRVRLRIVDAKGKPALARRELRRLAASGVHLVIGPQGSSEVAAARRAASRLGSVIISQGSTAHSLAIAGDNVLRFVPDDIREGEAVVALLRHDGIDAIVPVWRNDAGNAGLERSVRRQFRAAGGKVAVGVRYAADTTNFGGVASSISDQVGALRSAGAQHVGIYLAAFDEVVDLFHAAAGDPTLRIPWYGSDGVALSTRLVGDGPAAAFANSVGYPSPTVGLSDALRRRDRPLIARARKRLGRAPDALALTAYDALRIAVKATQRTGATRGRSLRRGIVGTADGHVGVTGRMKLNRAGDRAFGDFDFWSVCHKGTGNRWTRTFQYLSRRPGSGHILVRNRC